jgi:ferredoxin-NADP reductase
VLDETPDIRTFRLARPQGFDFAAGQFLAVRLRTEGREHVRCYSISSPPEASGYLEISVKRQGLVSGALHATVRPGSLLTVRPPAGAFRYPDDDDRPLLLVAGGVGITPLLSMLRHAAYTEPSRPATLLYSVRHECDLAFRDELQLLARRSPRIRVICAVSRGSDAPDLYPGRIDESLLRTVPDLEQSVALICGPEGLIDAVCERLAVIGVPPAQIRFERFDPAVAASSRARANGTPSRDEGSGPFCIRTASGGRRITIESGETLLEAAEREGLDIPSICRAGVCGTCRTRVLEGDVECTSDLLDADERGEGYVLACVSSVRSDCVIEG